MKKLLVFAMLLFALSVFAQEEVQEWDSYDVGWWTTTNDSTLQVNSKGVSDNNVDIYIDVDASPYHMAWPITITNLSSEQITVKWMKSQIKGSRIVLGDASIMTLNSDIPDDIIYQGNKLFADISSVMMAKNQFIRPIYLPDAKRDFKKGKKPQITNTEVILCLEIGEKEKIYRFTLNAVYNGQR